MILNGLPGTSGFPMVFPMVFLWFFLWFSHGPDFPGFERLAAAACPRHLVPSAGGSH